MTPTPRAITLRNRLGVLCIVLAALALQRGTTLSWGHAAAAEGARIEVSAIGLTKVAADPAATGSPTRCRWWPAAGDAALCAVVPGATDAFRRLRVAYPLLSIAIWLAVVSLFLQVLHVPRRAGWRVALTWSVAILGAAAVALVTTSAQGALAALEGSVVRYSAPGFFLVVAAVLLSATAGWMQREG